MILLIIKILIFIIAMATTNFLLKNFKRKLQGEYAEKLYSTWSVGMMISCVKLDNCGCETEKFIGIVKEKKVVEEIDGYPEITSCLITLYNCSENEHYQVYCNNDFYGVHRAIIGKDMSDMAIYLKEYIERQLFDSSFIKFKIKEVVV